MRANPVLKRTSPAIVVVANDEEDKLLMRGLSITPISFNAIHNQDDMEKFQQTLLYPNIKQEVTNQVTRRIVGIDNTDPYYMSNLFSEHEFSRLVHSVAEEVWSFV